MPGWWITEYNDQRQVLGNRNKYKLAPYPVYWDNQQNSAERPITA